MGYRLVEVDVTRPLPELPFDAAADGVGLLLRDGGRPLGFLFVARSGTALPAPDVERLAVRAGADGVLAERLRCALIAREGGRAAAAPAPLAVTVAVCTRDRPDDLAGCLDSVRLARGAHRVDVLVVDNCPADDRTHTLVSGRSGVRYVREPVAGLDVARNRALAEARGDWIVFVDDDVRVDRGWLDGLAAAVHEHPDAAAVTGLVLPAQLETKAQVRFEQRGGFGRGYAARRWDGRHGPGSPLHPLGAGVFGAGCNMAFRVAALRSLGGFDDALDTGPPLPGGGDLDAFYRVLHAGHVLVYEPRMAAFHRHRRELAELRRQYHSWGSGFAAYLGARWADRDERGQVVRMILWWLRYQQRELRRRVRWRDLGGVRMAWAELSGGVTGLGGYARSRRRMARRRAAVAVRPPGPAPDAEPHR